MCYLSRNLSVLRTCNGAKGRDASRWLKRIAKPETGKQDLFTTQRNLQPFWKFVTSHSPKESCIWKILTFSNFSKTKEFVQNTIIWFKAKSVLLRVGLNLWLQTKRIVLPNVCQSDKWLPIASIWIVNYVWEIINVCLIMQNSHGRSCY